MEVTNDSVLSVDELLARSAAAAASKQKAGGSKIQQMLAGEDLTDKVELSAVAKLLSSADAQKAKQSEPYTEQDWYIKAKVGQLKAQIAIYQNLPGLDPSGAVMDALGQEVYDLVNKQQAKLKKSTDEAAAKKAELDKVNAEKALTASIPSVQQLLDRAAKRLNGETVSAYTPPSDEDAAKAAAVKALLAAAKKKAANQTA